MYEVLTKAHEFLKAVVKKDDIVVDATMGNGNDTGFLASLGAKVFAFDIQKTALENTNKRLEKTNLSATLVPDGHQNVDKYIKSTIKAAIFNLGYLPKSDMSIVTKAKTTVMALEKLLKMLEKKGRIAIVVYTGHDGGQDEATKVVNFVKNLGDDYIVSVQEQRDNVPFLVAIEKQ